MDRIICHENVHSFFKSSFSCHMALRWHDSIMILTDAVLFVFFFVSFRGTRVLIPLETKTLSFSNFVLKKMLSLLDPRK